MENTESAEGKKRDFFNRENEPVLNFVNFAFFILHPFKSPVRPINVLQYLMR
jgi:hypothetical protein